MRLPEVKATQRGKSINLALSERGLSALRNSGLDLDKLILEAAVPLHARMVHTITGHQMSQAYGKKDQVCIFHFHFILFKFDIYDSIEANPWWGSISMLWTELA